MAPTLSGPPYLSLGLLAMGKDGNKEISEVSAGLRRRNQEAFRAVRERVLSQRAAATRFELPRTNLRRML